MTHAVEIKRARKSDRKFKAREQTANHGARVEREMEAENGARESAGEDRVRREPAHGRLWAGQELWPEMRRGIQQTGDGWPQDCSGCCFE